MKRTLFLGALLLSLTLSAQNKLAQFNSISWWDKDYLTLTWGGAISTTQDSRKTIDYINSLTGTENATDKRYYFNLTDKLMFFGSRLIEIDGKDAKGMTEKQADKILAEKHGHVFLLDLPTTGDYIAQTDQPLPVWMQAYGFNPLTCNWKKETKKLPDNYKVRVDKEAPWRNFKTFDFLILSDDVLADKELLEKIGRKYEYLGFTRDEVNPDLLISVTKDANKSIDYTYVPETQQQVHTGTNTIAMYGWKGKYLGNFSIDNYKTVKSGGYTQKTASTSAYLEVSVLQASRMGEPVVPMIYQLKYNYNNNTDANIDNLYLAAVSWVEHPLYDPYSLVNYTSTTCGKCFWGSEPLINFGIVTDAHNVILGLDKNSDVVKSAGLRKGDRIISIKSTFRKSMSGRSKDNTYYGTITISRDNRQQVLKFKRCHRTNDYKISFVTTYNTVK